MEIVNLTEEYDCMDATQAQEGCQNMNFLLHYSTSEVSSFQPKEPGL